MVPGIDGKPRFLRADGGVHVASEILIELWRLRFPDFLVLQP